MYSDHDFDHSTRNQPENLSVTRDAVWLGAMLMGVAGLAFWSIM